MAEKIKLSVAKKIISEWETLKLSSKHIRFLSEYISNGFNKTEAYAKAVAGKKTKRSTIGVEACNLFKKEKIKKAFQLWKDKWLGELKERLEPELIDIIWKRANYDISIFKDEYGKCKKISDIPKEWHCCIDGVETKYYGKDADEKVVNFKLPDRDRAIDKLDKYIKLTTDTSEISHVFISEEAKEKARNIFNSVKLPQNIKKPE